MEVGGLGTDPKEKWTKPFPDGRVAGVVCRLLSGDVYDPRGPWTLRPDADPRAEPNWFNALPASAHRAKVASPRLPFVSVGLGPFGLYAGFKVYGFDSLAYLDFPGVEPADVAPGSRAMCLSIRFTSNRPRKESQ